jgi:GNAT superfamily N-acetyltransferase
MVGALGGAAVLGLFPGIGDAAAKAVKSGARGLLDTAKRVEVDPNAMGSLLGNVRLKPKVSIQDTIQSKYPDVSVDLFGDSEKGYELSKIVVPKGSREQGTGTKVMKDILSLADAQGARVSLTPDSAFGGSKPRLKKFYKKFGFVDNKGSNKDFTTRNTMYRDPVTPTPSPAKEVAGLLAPAKPTAAELRRQANIQRFGYDPSEASAPPSRAATEDAGFERYLKKVNPSGKRIAAEDRPNLAMGDMYGMLPKGSEVVGSSNGVTFHRGPDGNYYATAFNSDVGEEDVIGYITNRGDGTELAVVQEMQGKGVGGELQYLFRNENPNAPTGGLTEAGEASLSKTYQRLAQEGLLAPSPAQEVAGLLSSGRADEVTDEMLSKLTSNDNMELFELYQSGATGMDLPMDEASRMARAQGMGRQAEGLHGTVTGNDFSSFRGDRETYIAPVSQEGLDLVSQFSSADQGRVFPLMHTSDILDTADPSGMSQQRRNMQALYDKNNLGDFKPSDKGLPHWSDMQAINVARDAGYGGIKLEERDWVDSTAVFDPSNIRSRFARFDPRLAHLRNLSAGVGGLGLLSSMMPPEEQY